MTWQATSDYGVITVYDIYRNGILLASVSDSSYTDSGLAAGTTYNYSVIAKDGAGNVLAASNSFTAKTLLDGNSILPFLSPA